jgi:hypothetical protein
VILDNRGQPIFNRTSTNGPSLFFPAGESGWSTVYYMGDAEQIYHFVQGHIPSRCTEFSVITESLIGHQRDTPCEGNKSIALSPDLPVLVAAS